MNYVTRSCSFKYRVSAVEKVVDGDTIDCRIDLGFGVYISRRVRLLGVDTPESRTRDPEEKKFGMLSKEKLKQWCHITGSEIELRCPDRDSRGKFGRILAEVWVIQGDNKTNVNRWMCEGGYAVPYAGQNKVEVQQLHLVNREKVRGEVDHNKCSML